VKIRYRAREVPAWILPMPDRRAQVIFDEPMRDLTPGQAAVMYEGEVVLGLGIIVRAEREPSPEAMEAIPARAALS
jgi:tRNA (5-methylaminomethyl-2-thiouridylate)-methyltransferase (EC 2.1.1.61)